MATRPPKPAAARGSQRASPRAPARAQLVLRQFRILFNAMKTHFAQVERRAGIGGAQLWALSIVAQSPGCTLGDLGRAMDIHQSTASNLAKALVERGLVAVASDAEDKRTRRLRILAAGRRLLRQAPGPFTGILPQALDALDAATLARLQRDLETLIALLQTDPKYARVPLGQQ